jgi:hypothetical protein
MTKAEHLRLLTWRSKILQLAADGEPDSGVHLPLLQDLTQGLLHVGAALYDSRRGGAGRSLASPATMPRATSPEFVS